jgi:hypothetical protein
VSEMYVYNAMPALALVVGSGAVAAFRHLAQNRKGRFVAYGLAACLCASHVVAVRGKALGMAANGEKASALLGSVLPFTAAVPRDGVLILMNPDGGKPGYSVIDMSGFDVLRYGTNIINQESGRDDMSVWVVSRTELAGGPVPPGAVILTLRGGAVVRLEKEGVN